jgi:GNAT superfamily N-acetyltransferase
MATKSAFTFRPLKTSDWTHIEALFGETGACGGCWCMYWRVPSTGRYWAEHKGAPNRRSFRKLVEAGRAAGILAFEGRTPVGWCSLGPRADFAYLARARKLPPPPDGDCWSVTCFFIKAGYRRSGVAGKLLDAAINFARRNGASALEGYPSVPKAAGEKIADAFAHTGVPKLFEAAGFEMTAKAGARNVYRLSF